jgi:hypothetical protein
VKRIFGALALAFGLAAPAAAEAELRLDDRYTSLDGVTHTVWSQWTQGVEVYDRFVIEHVAADGRLISKTGTPVRNVDLNTVAPRISARAAQARFGGRTRLVAFGSRLAWRVDAPEETVIVDATDGRVLERRSLVSDANSALVYDSFPDQRTPPRTVNLSADPTWIDRSEGGTKLQGNNAHATTFVEFTGDPVEVAQVNGNWAFPVLFFNQAECPAFGCTFDSDQFTTRLANREQTATQAFYYVNHFHDWALAPPIGFDEASRNYEHVNASGEGSGADAISVLTNHSVPDGQWVGSADGSPPEMRLGRAKQSFGYPYDVRLSDSAAIVYHEYGHGLTARLVGPGTGCCPGVVGEALAEGWSDWYAMDLLVEEGDVVDGAASGDVIWDAYFNAGGRTEPLDCAVGASAALCPGEGTAGSGGYTFGDFGAIRALEEHANGEIWAQTLWDLRQKLGGRLARCVVTGGLRLSPQSPDFLTARDAILAHALVVGVSQAKVWEAFAGRGMGPDAEATNPPTDDFNVPDDLPPAPAPTGSCGGGGSGNPPPSGPPPSGPLPPSGGGGVTNAQIAAALDADFPAIAKSVKRLRLRKLARRRGFTVKGLDALTAGRFTVQLSAKKLVIAKGTRAVAGKGRYALTVKLTKKGRKRLRGARRIKVTLTVRFAPAAGTPVARSTKAKLKR